MGPKNVFFQNVHFRGPNWVGGAWYGIFLIREKPALSAGSITQIQAKEMKDRITCKRKFPLISYCISGYWKHCCFQQITNTKLLPTLQTPSADAYFPGSQCMFRYSLSQLVQHSIKEASRVNLLSTKILRLICWNTGQSIQFILWINNYWIEYVL